MGTILPGTLKRCSLCQVEIRGLAGGQEQVIFSQGAPGTRAKLWARVCQYVKEPQRCLNQDVTQRGAVQVDDFYGEPPSFGPFDGAGAVGAGEPPASS
ncbi:hypothetical protein KQ302_09060 [Synechococcus sp. CS-602]|uniref:hypothetical protein n=1 Tax=Synechococcaceae TaxID=1890426 RepID=UPI0008FF0930|nr:MULTISPECIES: hypothetical protein [Synechococcaceae]MCT4363469.1 hypothetical protein [Candidatus Regnicoccus frigidus MAG-AL1]APD48464.1 hypothetical protein BM449_09740 [Synechococcus sp. SynAce01]MCT0203280.1 hypothetical protein [Synechococcus sp. CS-603]MCT0205240.1 hypothetical protein [Synechococcus sp. CS-602]MCT0246733.1 hypothetical protein [Synechococcus sp. CS-601]